VQGSSSASEKIEQLARDAIDVTKKARRHRQNLSGDNFYANKLATLRADATNAFRSLSSTTVGESSAIAELIESVFAAATDKKRRTAVSMNLSTTCGPLGGQCRFLAKTKACFRLVCFRNLVEDTCQQWRGR